MKGHEQVIALRRRGRMPPTVTLWADGSGTLARGWDRYGCHAQVDIEPADKPERLDLRFVVGVPLVWVRGDDAERVRRVAAAAVAAKAVRVIGVAYDERGKVAAMTDTDEVMTWPS